MTREEDPAPQLALDYKQALRRDLADAELHDLPMRLRERLARVVLDEMYQFTGLLDLQGNLLEANYPAVEAGGLGRKDVLGQPVWQTRWFQTSSETADNLQAAVRSAADGRFVRYDVEVFAALSGAERIFVDFSLKPVWDETGQVVFLLAEGRDIDERKRTEAETSRKTDARRVSEQDRAAQTLRASEAQLHQLNETLEQQVAERTALAEHRARQLRRLATQLTQVEQRERRRLSDALHDNLQQLLAAARMNLGPLRKRMRDSPHLDRLEQIDQLVGESIEVSRSLAFDLSPPVLHDAGLAAGLTWLARNLRTQYEFDVQLDADPRGDPTAEYTEVFLFQAIRELLLNVIHHAGVPTAAVRLRRLDDNQVELVVADRGQGFDVRLLEQESPSEQFGLFSIRERLELLGGELEIQSQPGYGTTVTLVAPRNESDRLASHPPQQLPLRIDGQVLPAEALAPVRVLLVDDHQVVRHGLARLLEELPSVEVIGEAEDGREAVKMTRTLRPDVVLMDITMPGMDGIEATRRITHEFPAIRVVGLSMHEGADMAAAMRAAGASAYLPKGGPLDTLASTIRGS